MNNSNYIVNKIATSNNYKDKNRIIMRAEYECYNNGKIEKYESDYVSIIDIPYRRYELV